MCIAIYKPEGVILEEWVYRNSFNWNDDGAGFVVHNPENNTLIVQKGYFKLKHFLRAFAPYERMRAILHFRIGTGGLRDVNNCHPFAVNDGLAFVHNGIIRKVREWNKDRSDTWHFNEAVLKKIVSSSPDIWKNPAFKHVIEEYIGSSKLIFMDNKGAVKIYNESMGHWNSKCWFSNDSYTYTSRGRCSSSANSISQDSRAYGPKWNQPKAGDKDALISLDDEMAEYDRALQALDTEAESIEAKINRDNEEAARNFGFVGIGSRDEHFPH